MRILLTSVGRRGYLVRYFKDALGPQGQVWGGDQDANAAAFHYCDNSAILPKVTDSAYVDELLAFCVKSHIDIVIPLIDPGLAVLTGQRDRFYQADIMVVVSPSATIEIAADKYLTYEFGLKNGIAVPETACSIEQAKEFLDEGRLNWPLVVKPRKGSASSDITYCRNIEHLQSAFAECPSPIIQQFLEGKEYGYDIFCDRQYRPISVFCKLKLAMRAGETDKAISTDDSTLTEFGLKIAQSLELFGPLDADVIMTSDRGPVLLEMNPRFGGGYPCSHLCNAQFPAKLISIAKGQTLTADIGSCPPDIAMFKEDEIIASSRQALDSIPHCSDNKL